MMIEVIMSTIFQKVLGIMGSSMTEGRFCDHF